MTRLPGRVDLSPVSQERWLGQMADVAARIHDAAIAAPACERWVDAGRLAVPATASRPELWRALARVVAEQESPCGPRFIHGDFQHFNLLWSRGRLTGVVDWGSAASGPPDMDAGHCRLNLAVLFGADWAERFRLAYEAVAGRRVDPWWDLYALASYNDSWPQFIPVQVDGRAPVEVAGMTGRVEELLHLTLRRLLLRRRSYPCHRWEESGCHDWKWIADGTGHHRGQPLHGPGHRRRGGTAVELAGLLREHWLHRVFLGFLTRRDAFPQHRGAA
jgi:hypothetical protein